MKNYLFIVLNGVGGFFAYVSLGILIYWIFHVEIFFPPVLKKSVVVAIGTIFLLPAISFVIVKFGNQPKISKIFAFIYLSLWLIDLIRLFALLN